MMARLVVLFTLTVLLHLTYGFLPDDFKTYKKYKTDSDLGEPLILTPYLEDNRIQEARAAAEVKLDVFQGVKSYSGFFNVDKEINNNVFFWFFPSVDDYDNDPVVLWVQGILGYTALHGVFLENGPFAIAEDGSLSLREYSWHKNQSILYIDQPGAPGFSVTNSGYPEDQVVVGARAYEALRQFFTLFPELQEHDFFIAGEGYAGKYIPAIGYTINQSNESLINLKGFLIGNGWSDPDNQISYTDLFYKLGLADSTELDMYYDLELDVLRYIRRSDYNMATSMFTEILGYLQSQTTINSIYNYLTDNDDESEAWQPFVNQDDVRTALHVGSLEFVTLDHNVYFYLYKDITKTIVPWISELLDYYKFLVYNGQLDIIVNSALTNDYLQLLNFTSAAEFKKAPRQVWYVNQEIAGFVKVAGNLTQVIARNAGHFVISDQPARGNRLVYYFTRGIPLE